MLARLPSLVAISWLNYFVAVPSKGKGQYALICPAIGFHPTRVQYSTVAAEERDGANRARWQSHGAVKPHFVPPQRCGKDGRARKSPLSAGRFGMQSVERGLVPIHRLIQRRRSHLLFFAVCVPLSGCPFWEPRSTCGPGCCCPTILFHPWLLRGR
jgi:hypothetical protein